MPLAADLLTSQLNQIQETRNPMQPENFYRPDGFKLKQRLNELQRVTVVDTVSEIACDRLQADNCTSCHAAYGHKIECATWSTRTVAQAENGLSQEDTLRLAALGVIWP